MQGIYAILKSKVILSFVTVSISEMLEKGHFIIQVLQRLVGVHLVTKRMRLDKQKLLVIGIWILTQVMESYEMYIHICDSSAQGGGSF